MDPADRIPDSLDGFTAAEAVAVLGRRMPMTERHLLVMLRELRIRQRIEYHLATCKDLQDKAEKHHGAAWLRAHDNISRHHAAIKHLESVL